MCEIIIFVTLMSGYCPAIYGEWTGPIIIIKTKINSSHVSPTDRSGVRLVVVAVRKLLHIPAHVNLGLGPTDHVHM